jgi:DNA replication and repair protein RecF
VRDGLVRTGAEAVEVFVEWQEGAEVRHRRAGLRHTGQTWVGRLDGQKVSQLGELCAALAVVSFEPGSHALVSGGGEPRRRFVDWGLFHVEPGFLPLWRRYARALKQRNALLKSGASGQQLDAWDHELAEAGEPMTRHRRDYLEQLQTRLLAVAGDLVPTLGASSIEFQSGWRRSELSLADALLVARDRDRAVGYTTVGPHRADWRIDYAGHPHRESLSRGQAKLSALSALLAQAEDYAQRRGEWPIMALDDLASELDRNHQRRVLQRLLASGAQVFVTGTELPSALLELEATPAVFHVEHGSIQLR